MLITENINNKINYVLNVDKMLLAKVNPWRLFLFYKFFYYSFF
jgi:hypothetical protein